MFLLSKLKKLLSLLLSLGLVRPNPPTTPVPMAVQTTTPSSNNIIHSGVIMWASLDKIDTTLLVEGGSVNGAKLFVARGILDNEYYVPGMFSQFQRQTSFAHEGVVFKKAGGKDSQLLMASPGALTWINVGKNSSEDIISNMLIGGLHPGTEDMLGICRANVRGNRLIGYFDAAKQTCHLPEVDHEATVVECQVLLLTDYGMAILKERSG